MSEQEQLRETEMQRDLMEMRLDEARMEVAVLKAQLCRMAMKLYKIKQEEAEVMVYGSILSSAGDAGELREAEGDAQRDVPAEEDAGIQAADTGGVREEILVSGAGVHGSDGELPAAQEPQAQG